MKRSIILSLLFLSSFSLATLASSNHKNSVSGTSPKLESSLKKLIDKHVIYPVFQNENMEGTVEVSFKIDTQGEVNILNIKSSNPELVDYVVKKLKKIKLEQSDESVGQTIKYRFVFKKQA